MKKNKKPNPLGLYKISSTPVGTFNGFGKEKNSANRIDYIFGLKNNKVKFNTYQLDRGKRGGRFISDHYPVIVDAIF